MGMHVLALEVELRLTTCRSLKEKGASLRPIIEGLRNRHQVSVAETDYQDQWQRAGIGVCVVSGSPDQAEEWMDRVERFVWSRPDIEITRTERHWLELEN